MKRLFAKITLVGEVIKKGKLKGIAKPITFFTEESPIEHDCITFKVQDPKYWVVGSFAYAIYDPDTKFWSLHKFTSKTEYDKAKKSFDKYRKDYGDLL